jgi:hypothetical protein
MALRQGVSECLLFLPLVHAREFAAWVSEYRLKWDIGLLADPEKSLKELEHEHECNGQTARVARGS